MVFAAINVVIAISYALLAWFFGKRIILPEGSMKKGWRVLLALAFAAMFFVGCAHTHIDLAIDAFQHNLHGAHWTSWWNQVSHVFQAIGGLGFYTLASRWVKLNIFDKQYYEEIAKEVES